MISDAVVVVVGPRPATVGPVSTFFTLNTELGHDLILLKHENYTHCSTAPVQARLQTTGAR